MTFIPGHGAVPHVSVMVSPPLQLLPPYWGMGLVQLRDLDLWPVLQVTEHALHDPQSDHPPWTECKKCWASVRGVNDPCSLYKFPSCLLLLSLFCRLLLFHFFPCSFLICRCSPLLFFVLLHDIFLAPFFLCSMLPFYHFWCSLLQDYLFSAPCSFTDFTACSLLLCVK